MSFKPHTAASINKTRHSGFSLIELMVSLAILAILASLAAPSFSESIKRYRINAIREDLTGSIQLARAEAIRRGRPVALFREVACGVVLVDLNDWSCGWRMVEDSDSNNSISALERGITPVDATRVLQTTTVPKGYGLMHPGRGTTLLINRWGQATGAGHRFVITPPEGVSGAATSTVCINTGGRIRTLKGSVTCP